MSQKNQLLILFSATAFGVVVAGAGIAGAQTTPKRMGPTPTAAGDPNSATEQQRIDAQKAGDDAIDKDAVAAIEEAHKAVKLIAVGKNDDALAAIERATGRINVLTARKPAAALIPVKSEVSIIDTASKDPVVIEATAAAAKDALSSADYPKARYLLDELASEIHVKTYHLPLATYPAAMQTAARLMDEEKNEEARQALLTALNTVIVTDQAIPLPLVEAQQAIKDAQQKREKDKPAARRLLGDARGDLDRAKALGYANKDPQYAALSLSISDLDKQLGGTESTSLGFASLRDKMTAFFERVTHKAPPPDQQPKE